MKIDYTNQYKEISLEQSKVIADQMELIKRKDQLIENQAKSIDKLLGITKDYKKMVERLDKALKTIIVKESK